MNYFAKADKNKQRYRSDVINKLKPNVYKKKAFNNFEKNNNLENRNESPFNFAR